MGVIVEEVRLEPLQGARFIAVTKIRNGEKVSEVEASPESAIALAARTGCPIYASDDVLKTAARDLPEDLGNDPEELLQALTTLVYYQDRRVTDRFRQCMRGTWEEARRMNSLHIEPVHLVLGLLKARDEPILSLLQMFDLEPDTLKERIEKHREGTMHLQAKGEGQSISSSVRELLEITFNQADHKREAVDTDHLLKVLIKSGWSGELQDALTRSDMAIQTGLDMQMGLMPKDNPTIEGFDIAGSWIPCRDSHHQNLFKFAEHDNKLMLTVANVTPAGMPFGVRLVMFDGLLNSQIGKFPGMEDLLSSLDRLLFLSAPNGGFISFTMAELNPATRSFRVVNGGGLGPYHFRARTGEFKKLQADTRQLGTGLDTGGTFEGMEIRLESGDRMVLVSDGIRMARNGQDVQVGVERTSEAVRRACEAGLPAAETIDRILADVEAFRERKGPADMTFVVVVVN